MSQHKAPRRHDTATYVYLRDDVFGHGATDAAALSMRDASFCRRRFQAITPFMPDAADMVTSAAAGVAAITVVYAVCQRAAVPRWRCLLSRL